MKFLLAIVLAIIPWAQVDAPFFGTLGAKASSGCTPSYPPLTNYYAGFNSGNNCTGGCGTTGNNIVSLADSISSNTATHDVSLGSYPTITTGVANGQSGAAFSNATLTFGTYIPYSWTNYVVYVTFKVSSLSAYNPFISGCGGVTSSGCPAGLTFGVNTSGELSIDYPFVAHIGNGTKVLSTNTIYSALMSYDPGTGAWAIYEATGGTPTLDASGTQTSSSTVTTPYIGYDPSDSAEFAGTILDLGIYNGTYTSGNRTTWATNEYCLFKD